LREIVKKFSNNKLHENPTKGSQVVSCGGTGRNDEVTVAFVIFQTWLKMGVQS